MRQTTIFYGNGVNRLSKDGKSWDNVLRQISQGQFLPPIENNTLKYEYIVLPKDRYIEVVDDNIKEEGKTLPPELKDTEKSIKEDLASELSQFKAADFYKKLAELKADNYMTTNYESHLINPFFKMGYHLMDPDNRIYKTKPHYTLEKGESHIKYWNIHGCLELQESMLLGLYEYSKYVINIDKIIRSIERDLPDVDKESWPYIMLHSDVHILGFGLGYEEIDIWYFLTSRKRLLRTNKIEKNRITYYVINDDSFDIGKVKLLEALDVEVKIIDFDWSSDAYKKAYEDIYNRIKYRMNNE
ncbi:MAG: hypothetical protein IJ081_05600 [Prevotella sp.]|nr:hypothetical protein [Prevotella sp.]